METIRHFFKILFVAILFSSCSVYNNCLEGNGNTVTQTLNLNTFSKLSTKGSAKITISQGDTQSVTIVGDSNIIENLITEIVNNELKIKPPDGCIKNFNIDINIVVTDFAELTHIGAGDITINSFSGQESLSIRNTGAADIKINSFVDTHSLTADIRGSGSITLQGTNFYALENTEVSITGSAIFFGFDVPSKNYAVMITGSGKCKANATKTLDVNILGSGDVYYIGNPEIKQNISGTGSLVNKN